MIRNLFQSLAFALISQAHLNRHMDRLSTVDLSRLQKARLQDDGSDDEQNDDETPWWKKEDIWGDPLPAPYKIGSKAVVPVKGVLTSGYPTIFRAIGFADTEEIRGWVRAARNDSSVSEIVMPYDSPGGMYAGTPELADEVNRATLSKRVVAQTNGGMIDSAAYWVASQSDELYCTQSSDIGCIGVYQIHYDWTQYLHDYGITAEMFKSGDLKGAGHPDIPLSAEQRAHIQAEIEAIGAEFRAAVKSKRTLVEDDSMRGQSFIGTEAVARNLVHGLRDFESLF